MRRSAVFPVFFFLAASAFGFNQSMELKGIQTVNVMVSDLSDDLVNAGVQKDSIAAVLELALKNAGIAVLAHDQYSGTVPTIWLRVSEIKEPHGRFFATDIVLECLDNVYNNRIAGPFDAVIWSRDVLQFLGAVDSNRIVDGEKKLIDMFLSDYAQANRQ